MLALSWGRRTHRANARSVRGTTGARASLNSELLRAERVATERFCTACEMRLHPDVDHLAGHDLPRRHPVPFALRAGGRVEQ